VELLIKIGDSGGSKDGQVIAAKPDGWLIPGTAMVAWIDLGKAPAVLAEMPRYLADQIRRVINRIRWDLAHTVEGIVAEYNIRAPTQEIAEQKAEQYKALAVADRARMIVEGADTNWGYEDLRVHFALKIDSDDPHDFLEFVDCDRDTDHLATWRGKRRNKVDYSQLYDAAKLTLIADKQQRVDVDRTALFAKAVVEPIVAVEVTT